MAIVQAVPVDLSVYLKSTKVGPFEGDIIAHGPPASGKTRFFATVSEHFPEKTGEVWVMLDDVFFLTFDKGALDGLKVEKLEVHSFDVRAAIAALGAVKGTFDALKFLGDYLKRNPQIKYVVTDTISEMAELWQEHFGRNQDDKWAVFRHLGETHTRFKAELNKVVTPTGVQSFFASHSKARVINADSSDAQKKAAIAEKLPGGNDIGLDIDGQGRGTYTRNASLIFAAQCKQMPGKEPIYVVMPRGGNGFEGKDRLARILKQEEEPNLGKILKKLNLAAAA